MKKEQILCDGCSEDLTETGEMPAFRLKLESEAIQQVSNISFSCYVKPLIHRSHHFCGSVCLKNWLECSKNSSPPQ
jgi:hypothetical protein